MNEQEIQRHRDACIEAIERGDIDFITEVLEKHPELRTHSRFVLPVADEAIENDNLAALRLFEEEIRQDAQSDDPYGANLLICDVSKQGKPEFMRFLISCGADVNASISAGFRPLELALDKDHFEVAEILLDAGAEFAYDTFEHNSLLKAVRHQDLEKVRWLLERGFDPHVTYRYPGGLLGNVLEAAFNARKPDPSIIDQLRAAGCHRPVEGQDEPIADYTAKIFQTIRSEAEFVAFFDAIRAGDVAHIRGFCDKHTFFTEQRRFPSDAWECAARNGHGEVAKALAEYRGWLNERIESLHRFGAFLTAIRHGQIEFAEVTFDLALTLDFEVKYDNRFVQRNPVFVAIANGQQEMLQWLIDKEFDLQCEYRFSDGRIVNALTFGRELGDSEIVKILQTAGCKPPRRLTFRKREFHEESDEAMLFVTPSIACLDALSDRLPEQALQRLASAETAGQNNELRQEMCRFAAETGQASFLAGLLTTLEADSELTQRCLYEATRGGHIEIVRLLVDLGPDLNDSDRERLRPGLMKSAICNGHLDIAQFFHARGLELPANPPSNHAIFWAMDIDRDDLVQWLLTTEIDANASYQKRDGKLANALTRARKENDHVMAKMLEHAGCSAPTASKQ